jgi:hypothetical protein
VAVTGVALSLHHAWRTAVLYLLPASPEYGTIAAIVATALGAALGLAIAHARRQHPGDVAWYLAGGAAAALAASFLPFLLFERGGSCASSMGALFALASFATATLAGARRSVFQWLWALRLAPYALSPLRIAVAGAAVFASLWLGSKGGHLRFGVIAAAWLLLAAAGHESVLAYLEGRPSRSRIAVKMALAAAILGAVLLVAEALVPAPEIAVYPDDIVFASSGASHRYVVAASPAGYESFEDAVLLASPIDGRHRAEAFTRLPLQVVPSPARALVLFGGTPALPNTLRADGRVRSLTIVVEDAERLRIAASIPWMSASSDFYWGCRAGVEASGRPCMDQNTVVAEPLPWLMKDGHTYDVIIADLPPPFGYRAGKYYTRYFFQLLGAHLAPGGAVAVTATSALGARVAFEDVVATAKAAGLHVVTYHAAVPTVGVASFFLGANEDVSAEAPHSPEYGKDLASRGDGHVSLLHDQRVVEAFAPENAVP